jgi:putative transcriptional regulator
MALSLRTTSAGCLVAPRLTSKQVRAFRGELGLTQQQFAEEFDIPLGTLRRWEQGQSNPSPARATLLRLLQRVPKRLLAKAIETQP